MNPLLLTDFYKVHHQKMYPEGMTLLYSNFTPRKSRIPGVDKVVFFGLQHFCLEYLIKAFNQEFFEIRSHRHSRRWLEDNKKEELLLHRAVIIEEYQKHIGVDTKHIEALWDLGYLPIEIKAVPEGTLVPIGVPCFTIKNTHPEFAWLTNYLETLISCMMWQPITSATIAYEYKKLLSKYAIETTGSADFVQWQGHDFSMRGMSSVESAILSGMGHLLSFTGTDTIPAIYQLESSYNASGLIGASVPATEHSVMCMGEKSGEIQTFKRLLSLYPTGILSVVSDTWNLWKVLTEYLPAIKEEVLARDGKLVIRPDSGIPEDIICGIDYENLDGDDFVGEDWSFALYEEIDYFTYKGKDYQVNWEAVTKYEKEYGKVSDYQAGIKYYTKEVTIPTTIKKGVIELLWDLFGGTYVTGNDGKQYKQLDSHIGAIYGDSITLDRAKDICERLKAKGFASTNVVLGIGSYTYQYNTRDTFGFAMKATYGEVLERCDDIRKCHNGTDECEKVYKCLCPVSVGREIFKDPITDDGTKKSKKGLLTVRKAHTVSKGDYIEVIDQVSWEDESKGLLQTVFKDGQMIKTVTLAEIRERLNN